MSAPAGDAYDILGVSPSADDEAIKRAFRALARKFHPDVNTHPSAQERFLVIRAAYEELLDPPRRSSVDERRRARTAAQPPFARPGAGGGAFWTTFGASFLGRRPAPGFFTDLTDVLAEAVEAVGSGGGTYLHERTANDPDEVFDERFTGRVTGSRLIELDALLTRAEARQGMLIPFRFHLGPQLIREKLAIPPGVKKGEQLRYQVEAAPGIDLDLVVHVDIA